MRADKKKLGDLLRKNLRVLLYSVFKPWNFSIKSGIRDWTTSQIISLSKPKYSCAMTFRKLATSRQGISGCSDLKPLGICRAASPITSKLRTTARYVRRSFPSSSALRSPRVNSRISPQACSTSSMYSFGLRDDIQQIFLHRWTNGWLESLGCDQVHLATE